MNATELFIRDVPVIPDGPVGHAMLEAAVNQPDGFKTAGIFFCGACKIVARTQAEAEKCCVPRKCACGAECEPHWTACKTCRDAADVKREADRFAKAEKVASFDGPVYSEGHGYQDGYFDSMADFLDWWESDTDEGAVRPAYVWACDRSPCCRLDYDRIIEDATNDAHENFDAGSLTGDEALKAALDKFNELNRGYENWTPNHKLAVLVPAEKPDTAAT